MTDQIKPDKREPIVLDWSTRLMLAPFWVLLATGDGAMVWGNAALYATTHSIFNLAAACFIGLIGIVIFEAAIELIATGRVRLFELFGA